MKRITITLAMSLLAISPLAFGQSTVCDLTTPDEVEETLGAKPKLSASTLPNGVEV